MGSQIGLPNLVQSLPEVRNLPYNGVHKVFQLALLISQSLYQERIIDLLRPHTVEVLRQAFLLHILAIDDYFETSHFFLPSFKLLIFLLQFQFLGLQYLVFLINHGLPDFVLVLEFSI